MSAATTTRSAVAGLSMALALGSCGLPYDEAFVHSSDKVSGAAGTVWFVPSLRLRNCTWFECGERSSKTLGATVAALVLSEGADGLELGPIALIACDAAHEAACDTNAAHPQLRRVGGETRLTPGIDPAAATVAWADMKSVELKPSDWLCAAATLPASNVAVPVKIAPSPDFGRAAMTYSVSPGPSLGDDDTATCLPLTNLLRPPGAPDRAYLTDVVFDARGRLHIAYVFKDSALAWEGLRPMVASYDGEWRGAEIPMAAFGKPAPTMVLPGFLDARADRLILDAWATGDREAIVFRLYDRANGSVTDRRVALP